MTDVHTLPEPEGMTPEQRTMWLLHTDAAIRDHCAYNLWIGDSDLPNTQETAARWKALPQAERESWEKRAIAETEAYHASGPASRRLQDRNSLLRTTGAAPVERAS